VNVIAGTDLLYPRQPDPVGRDKGGGFPPLAYDHNRYVVWVDAGRPHQNGRDENYRSLPELAPRPAFHLTVRTRKDPAHA
jgi:hypothetical protein